MKNEARNTLPADLPSRRDFMLGGSVLGLGAAATGLVGCSEAGQSSGADADADTMGDRRLFNGLSAETSEVYPFEYKELEINGRRIHYVDEGSGPTVMLLHGQGNWSYHYRGVINRLKDRARVVCHDHQGSGLSDQPAFHRQYTIENHISTLYGVIEALDLRGITFYCMDWGGPISFAYSTANPDNMRGLVIGNTWAWGEHSPFLRSAGWRARHQPVVRPLWGRLRRDTPPRLSRPNPGGDWDTPAAHEVARYDRRYSENSETRSMGFNRSTQASSDHPLEYLQRTARTFAQIEAGLPGLQHLPVRVLSPENDPAFPPEDQERWRELFPNAPPVIRIPDSGHVGQASELGADLIAGAIGEVLDEAEQMASVGGVI